MNLIGKGRLSVANQPASETINDDVMVALIPERSRIREAQNGEFPPWIAQQIHRCDRFAFIYAVTDSAGSGLRLKSRRVNPQSSRGCSTCRGPSTASTKATCRMSHSETTADRSARKHIYSPLSFNVLADIENLACGIDFLGDPHSPTWAADSNSSPYLCAIGTGPGM